MIPINKTTAQPNAPQIKGKNVNDKTLGSTGNMSKLDDSRGIPGKSSANKGSKIIANPVTARMNTSKKEDNETKEIAQASSKLREHEKKGSSNLAHKSHKQKLSSSDLSPYARALLSPFEFKCAQIPDANTYPSSTFNITKKWTFAAETNPVEPSLGVSFAVCIGSYFNKQSPYYYGGNIIPMGDANGTKLFGCYTPGPSGGDTFIMSNQTVISTAIQSVETTDFAASYVDLWRPVCAGVKVTCIGPALTKQGYLVGASFPRTGLSSNGASSGVTFNNILNHPTAIQSDAFDTMEVHYSPTDNVNYEYLDPRNSYSSNIPLAWRDNRGELWIVGVGLQDAEQILIEVTIGVEFIPSLGVLNFIQVQPSWSSSHDMDQAENLDAVVPKAVTSQIESDVISVVEESGVTVHAPSKLLSAHTQYGISATKKTGNGVVGFLHDAREVYKESKGLLSEILHDIAPFAKHLL